MIDLSRLTLPDALLKVRALPDSPETDALELELRDRWPEDLYPQRGMQWTVAQSTASIVVLGGAAGSGKTWCVEYWPIQFLGTPAYNCTYIRRKTTEITAPGGLWDEATRMWGKFVDGQGNPLIHATRNNLEAVYPASRRKNPTWKVKLMHLVHETPDALEERKGIQSCDMVIEEATGFMEESVVYFLSRNRPMVGCPKPPQCFLTCNPDRDSWLFHWVRPWVDPEHPLYPTPYGGHRLMIRTDGAPVPSQYLLHQDGAIAWVTPDCPGANSITYIQGNILENRLLVESEGGQRYLGHLRSQDHINRERLLHGNWLIRSTDTHTFQRDWFQLSPERPASRVVRSWDYSVRRKYTRSRTKPDYTVGVKVALLRERKDGRPCYQILDMWRKRCTPSEAEDATAEVAQSDGKAVHIIQQTTHGDEGIRAVNMTRRYVVPGFTVHGVQLKGDKEDRAHHFSAAAQQGRVYVVEAPWTNDFLTECANFPNGRYDDQVDAVSVAISHLRGSTGVAAPTNPKKRRSQW